MRNSKRPGLEIMLETHEAPSESSSYLHWEYEAGLNIAVPRVAYWKEGFVRALRPHQFGSFCLAASHFQFGFFYHMSLLQILDDLDTLVLRFSFRKSISGLNPVCCSILNRFLASNPVISVDFLFFCFYVTFLYCF